MRKKEDGATEVVAFMIIITFVILGVLLWMFIAMPIYGENSELTHNDEVLQEMAGLKYQIDTLMLSQTTGVARSAVISLSPRGDKDVVTVLPDLAAILSSGTVAIEKGDVPIDDTLPYYSLKITYTSYNSYADNVTIVYEDGHLKDKNGNDLLSNVAGSIHMHPVVAQSFKPQILGGNEFAVIKFGLDSIVPHENDVYFIFTIDMDGSYNG